MLEIKNLRVAEFASEETRCYRATVYVDGKRAFVSRNDGHGGPDYHERLKGQSGEEFCRLMDRAIEIAEERQVARKPRLCLICKGKKKDTCTSCDEDGNELPMKGEWALECEIEVLIYDVQCRQALSRLLHKKVLMVNEKKELLESKKSYPLNEIQGAVAHFAEKNPKWIILNRLAFEEALELFKEVQ